MFYTFNQNNSGGSFVFDPRAGISHYVIVEADGLDDAMSRASRIGLYFDGVADGRDCDCCGDRWYYPWSNDGTRMPSVYSTPVDLYERESNDFRFMAADEPEIYVHYLNGDIVQFSPMAIDETAPESAT